MGKYKKDKGIYSILCSDSKKYYIGSTTNGIRKRIANHRNLLRRGRHKNPHLQAAFSMYGEEKFIFSVLEVLPYDSTNEFVLQKETEWILFYKSNLVEFGYNLYMPGSFPIKLIGGNITKKVSIPIIGINRKTKEVREFASQKIASNEIQGRPQRIKESIDYWENRGGRRKFYKDWTFIRKEKYVPEFDYSSHRKKRKIKEIEF